MLMGSLGFLRGGCWCCCRGVGGGGGGGGEVETRSFLENLEDEAMEVRRREKAEAADQVFKLWKMSECRYRWRL